MYDFTSFVDAISGYLQATFSGFWAGVVSMLLLGMVILMFYAFLGLFLVYAERKICARMQNRIGPNRVGPMGLFQTIADLIKLLLKELIYIRNADSFLFNIAPFIVIVASIMAIGSIPFAKGLQAIDLNIGVLYILAISSMGVIGILIAGWASNSKYSVIGAMRSGAQVISYELSVGLALLCMIVFAGSMQLSEIIVSQEDGWWIFKGHIPALIAFVIYLVAGTAETNRGPFDLVEAESELTAGFHTEYSGIKFAFFFLAEYMNMFIIAAIATTIFLGGWLPFHLYNLEGFNRIMDFVPPIFWFFGKTAFVVYLMMWFKWTFPRLRIDQLLTLEWKYLLPLNLMNLLVIAFLTLMQWHF
ncbi:NADH-quinone oxidoreductase subunit NuoH [Imperialibacter roseus]|uniref:NADH-quinone oxidoreductase subunit H n=1 Tax=Imperialibacter roseus TaxID=1324217 RepID=A0ABZ0IW05_9BACT|nr:NADH-quinone oxidoreductase subunit NuoH [Imperialibacter roseus]WOK08971.1 NADH-quinone oxidoreductase subunit NuoH [Imperialibacter roseus]